MTYKSVTPEKPVYVSKETHELLKKVSREIEMPMSDIADEVITRVLSDAATFRKTGTYVEGQRRKRWRGAYMKNKAEDLEKAQKHDYSAGVEKAEG
jgi:predicted RNA-binding protein YlxR (DUF448 family)